MSTDIDALVAKYKYSKLPIELSKQVRSDYRQSLPKLLREKGNREHALFTLNRMQIATGYERIVIGDYGAYIEIASKQMLTNNIEIKQGQEYRLEPKYKNVKYHWYTAKNESDIKIYKQTEYVTYADYKPSFYYVSPNEIFIPTEIYITTETIDSSCFIVDVRQKPYGKNLNYTDLIKLPNYTWCKELCILDNDLMNQNHGFNLIRHYVLSNERVCILAKTIAHATQIAKLLFNDNHIRSIWYEQTNG